MKRPRVWHLFGHAAAGPDAVHAGLRPYLTATVEGSRSGADLVHAHGLDALADAGPHAVRLGVPLVVSLSAADVSNVTPAATGGLRHALVLLTSLADAQRVSALGLQVAVVDEGVVLDGAPDAGRPPAEVGSCAADLDAHYLSFLADGRPAELGAGFDSWPQVEVVMLTYNRLDLLQHCLEGLAAQTYPADRMTVTVVDNGSADGTTEWLRGWEGSGRRVIRLEHNIVPAAARNAAVVGGVSDVVAFTDDDCRPTPQWLTALVCGFRERIAIVQGRTIADPGAELSRLSRTQWTPAEYGVYETANIAYRRNALPAGPFDLELAEHFRTVLGDRLGGEPFGEDAWLAWRVKRTGAGSRFSSTALVHHHVWPPDPAYLLRRSAMVAAIPVLVQTVPELRDVFLWRRWFLTAHRAEVLVALGAVALAAGSHRRRWLLLAAPYVWSLLEPTRPGVLKRIPSAAVLAARDAVESAALTYGSVRAKTLVL